MNKMDEITQADFGHHAEKIRKGCFEKESKIIETAISSGNYESGLNTALVAAWYYPENLKMIGYGWKMARQVKKCAYAYSVLEVLYRRAFFILAHIANKRGLDVAAVEAGQIALVDAYAPALHGDGTQYGLQLEYSKPWTETITGSEWDKLPVVTREELRDLKKVLDQLNHGVKKPILDGTDQIPIGQIHGKLWLNQHPSGANNPAVLLFHNTEYSVTDTRAWKIVEKLIQAKAFDPARAIPLGENPGQDFKKKKHIDNSKFWNDVVDHTSGRPYRWYLKS